MVAQSMGLSSAFDDSISVRSPLISITLRWTYQHPLCVCYTVKELACSVPSKSKFCVSNLFVILFSLFFFFFSFIFLFFFLCCIIFIPSAVQFDRNMISFSELKIALLNPVDHSFSRTLQYVLRISLHRDKHTTGIKVTKLKARDCTQNLQIFY